MNKINPSYIDLLLKPNLTGGNLDNVLVSISNIKNKYLEEKSNKSDKLTFQFIDEYNTQKEKNSNYLGKGVNTVVCAIKQIKDNNIYVIRIFERDLHSVQKIINHNYKNDKNNFDKAIPNIYCYGRLLNDHDTNPTKVELCYMIVDLYHTNFNKLNFCKKIKIFVNLLELLKKAHEKNYFFWELKFDNIGYDNDYNCVMIDYDDHCVKSFPVSDPYWYGGTYHAVYIMGMMALGQQHGLNTQHVNDEFHKHLLPVKYHDKLGICGLPDIIFNFFFISTIKYIFSDIEGENKKGNIRHSAYNFYEYVELRKKIQKYPRIYDKDKYNDFYNDIYDLLIDNDANGILSLYYHKVPTYEQMLNTFQKYKLKKKNIYGGNKKYVLLK